MKFYDEIKVSAYMKTSKFYERSNLPDFPAMMDEIWINSKINQNTETSYFLVAHGLVNSRSCPKFSENVRTCPVNITEFSLPRKSVPVFHNTSTLKEDTGVQLVAKGLSPPDHFERVIQIGRRGGL